jgi:hypothetical protein
LGALKTIINTAIDGINLVIRGLNLIKPGPDIASIGKIGSSTGSSSTGGISVPLASLPTGFKPAGTISTIPTPSPTPTPTPVASVAASAATAAAAAKKSNDAFKFGTSGVNTNTLAGIMAASGQPSVVINVNSPSIIDEEGFTRALNNAQNNSFFRGTGGATNLVGI